MRIKHRVSFGNRLEITDKLQSLSVEYDELAIAFDIFEDDERWPVVDGMIREHNGVDFATTLCSPAELNAAEWLNMEPIWYHGYPMPDDDFGYLELTYDLTEYCEDCGVGNVQTAPFRMRGEPKWGRRGILQLNWVFDEYFVKPEVWRAVFAPEGIEHRVVLHHRTGKELETVVQLKVQQILPGPLKMRDHPFEVCGHCKRKKYLAFARGMFPPLTRACDANLVQSIEWFGSGASAFRAFLVSQALYSRISEAKIRGASFTAVEAGDTG